MIQVPIQYRNDYYFLTERTHQKRVKTVVIIAMLQAGWIFMLNKVGAQVQSLPSKQHFLQESTVQNTIDRGGFNF